MRLFVRRVVPISYYGFQTRRRGESGKIGRCCRRRGRCGDDMVELGPDKFKYFIGEEKNKGVSQWPASTWGRGR